MLLAEPHAGLAEGIRMLLATMFDTVVMVVDERSLLEAAERLKVTVAVVALIVAEGDLPGLLRRLRERRPELKVLVLGLSGEPSVTQSVLAAGADGFLVKRAIATDLFDAIEAVLEGRGFATPPSATGHG